ncbi:hypothetical protein PV08_04892 [Exophiala spinifera]|uniref:FHA domain-containing protein n=1 Tax=Exophiala spinifera TaxID=91928 RepID=A0A0D1ZYG5_9EURO|nr:uncharacterized protein PV08_04892 [Exophiala spinifera]KIW17697.1 hypothetical protein PV08_04892 [Exophiala spinifera]
MWILESNGDFLQGKRMWLKPGQKYLFGRVRKDGVLFAIDHKTVSRRHFVIEVDNVADGDAGNIHARTKIRIIDQGSKSGTTVNGDQPMKGSSKELKYEENSVRPGNFPQEIIIKWQPCVLTFSLLKKEIKSGVLKTKQAKVQSLDIKATSDFLPEHTTYVIAGKRNTAKGLQALVTGKHVVTESYVDALQYAATPQNISQEENLSPLESDFDTAWPDPRDYLPPPGKEPTIRPAEAYQPDSLRATIFEGYTFVFLDQTQFDTLLPVITSGHGKAMLFKATIGETTSSHLIEFLRNAAGHKADGQNDQASEGKAILVRWSGKDDIQDFMNELVRDTALKMDQRAIEQSEFLDAILANDAGLLQQSIPFESTDDGRMAPPNSVVTRHSSEVQEKAITQRSDSERPRSASTTGKAAADKEGKQASGNPDRNATTTQTSVPSQESSKAESAPKPFSGPRFSQKTGFKYFDDAFDPDEIIDYEDDEADAAMPSPETLLQTSDIKEEPQTERKKRRRSPTPDDDDAFDEEIDNLLPAAAAFKRQKLAEGSGRVATRKMEASHATAKKAKKAREIDVLEVVKAQRDEREKAAQQEQEHLEAMGDIEDKGPANLVTVVSIQLPLRERSKNIGKVNGVQTEDWDPKWNGRKNFKLFRRKGEAVQRRGHATRVIVPVVPVQMGTHGLGEEYWPKTNEEKEREREQRRKEKSRSQTQQSSGTLSGRSRTRIVVEEEDDDEDEIGADEVQHQNESTGPAAIRLQQEVAEIVNHGIDPFTPRRTRASDRSQTASHVATTQSSVPPSSHAKGKRPASSALEANTSKRQRTLPVNVVRGSDDEDDDDSDDMKFRFGSRARRARATTKDR